ncbi:hypothetical protein KP509_08G044200 [Ceratopteris richardii]|uniref:Uncharacterized protein n=1 Tax=Ceratopteris richardii TaxID=49495 RepID=A0A8T2UA08_CERRI|nr:hypothetical protein KP509_08G044200 [Ceratopteris richardii]
MTLKEPALSESPPWAHCSRHMENAGFVVNGSVCGGEHMPFWCTCAQNQLQSRVSFSSHFMVLTLKIRRAFRNRERKRPTICAAVAGDHQSRIIGA